MIALKNLKRNKRFLLGFCALLVVAMVSVGVTLALTKVEYPYTTNVVTIGEVRIELIDRYYDLDGDKQTNKDKAKNGSAYSETNPPVFDANTDVAKTVKVKNIGNYSCYVRLQVQKEWIYQEGDTQTILDDYIQWQPSANWIEGEDEGDGYVYYYYTEPLDPGDETTGLFNGNKFHIGNYDKTFGSKAIGHIRVTAQAVQSDYTDGSFGELGSGKTFETKNGHVVKWNNLLFE